MHIPIIEILLLLCMAFLLLLMGGIRTIILEIANEAFTIGSSPYLFVFLVLLSAQLSIITHTNRDGILDDYGVLI